MREALGCATLQRDVLQAEKAEVAEALTKVGPCLPHDHPLSSTLSPGPSHTGCRLTPISV